MTSSRFYQSLILSLFLILPFQLSKSYADDVKDKKKSIEWLFVISSKEGEIKKNDQGQYELILNHAHIERVLAFSDRPNRIVKFISPQDFKKLWGEGGKNSFEKHPPNAIAVFGQKKIAMKLMSASVDKDKTSFVVSADDDKLRDVAMGGVSVFVDSQACAWNGSMVFSTKTTCSGKDPKNMERWRKEHSH